jgi:hypothetical protein
MQLLNESREAVTLAQGAREFRVRLDDLAFAALPDGADDRTSLVADEVTATDGTGPYGFTIPLTGDAVAQRLHLLVRQAGERGGMGAFRDEVEGAGGVFRLTDAGDIPTPESADTPPA